MNLIIPVPHPDKMSAMMKKNKIKLRNKDKDNPAFSKAKTT